MYDFNLTEIYIHLPKRCTFWWDIRNSYAWSIMKSINSYVIVKRKYGDEAYSFFDFKTISALPAHFDCWMMRSRIYFSESEY